MSWEDHAKETLTQAFKKIAEDLALDIKKMEEQEKYKKKLEDLLDKEKYKKKLSSWTKKMELLQAIHEQTNYVPFEDFEDYLNTVGFKGTKKNLVLLYEAVMDERNASKHLIEIIRELPQKQYNKKLKNLL